jgi:dolichol-phosphate mannosyltransferase
MSNDIKLSVVVPSFNEEEVITDTYNTIMHDLGSHIRDLEVVFIDDGSTDGTLAILKNIADNDERANIVSFSRNFGHQAAVTAGLDYATGDVVAIIDADLQDPPEVILSMIEEWKAGAKVVYAVRKNRKESLFKKIASYTFYRIYSAVSDIEVALDSGDFCVLDREVVNRINDLPEKNRFIRGLRSWIGYNQASISYDRKERAAGEPKYTFKKLMNLAMDGIFNFSTKPLYAVFYIGLIALVLSLFVTIFYLAYQLTGIGGSVQEMNVNNWIIYLSLLVLLLGSMQIISVGVLGQYIARIYQEVQARPTYIVKETVGPVKLRSKNE